MIVLKQSITGDNIVLCTICKLIFNNDKPKIFSNYNGLTVYHDSFLH